jgi:hypothetical protein
MAAPRGAVYAPKSGPLAGRVFMGQEGTTQAYNRYQQARAKALGFSNYRQERIARQSPVYKAIVAGDKAKDIPLNNQRRTTLLQALAQRQNIVVDPVTGRKTYKFSVDQKDHRRGGSLDKWLQAIGRRTGQEPWNPGETPK